MALALEVSHRTARRDLEALAQSGVPIYSSPGRNGGWSLVGGARTDLSGLTEPEARALFLLAGPGSSDGSASSREVQAALRKLLHALPATFREGAALAATTVHVDRSPWGRTTPPEPPFLAAVREAALDGRAVALTYADRTGAVTDRTVSPWGLVLKGPQWYLVAGTDAGRRTFRVSRIRDVRRLDEPAIRPAGLDLAQLWAASVTEVESRRRGTVVRAIAEPRLVNLMRTMLGERVRVVGPPGTGTEIDAGVEIEISAPDPSVAAAELAGYGDRLDVLGPPEVRERLARLGAGLVARYGSDG